MVFIKVVGDNVQLSNALDEDSQSAWDWESVSFEHVQQLAAKLSEAEDELYIATDAGEYVYPRYDIIKAPIVGGVVSFTFNGDYYPCGEIISISDSLRVITTSTGHKFYRRKNTGKWLMKQIWALVGGYHNAKNPSF